MQEIELIRKLIDDLCAAKLLLFDKHLALFLMALTKNETLLALIKECNRDFYFEEEAARLFEESRLPKTKKAFVALVIGLLAKADCGEITSSQLFTAIFPDAAGPNDAYSLFCERILLPLKDAMCVLLRGEPAEEEPAKNIVYDKMNEDAAGWIALLTERVSYNPILRDEQLAEVLNMCEGFIYALESSTVHIQRLIWLGLKNTLHKYRLYCNEIDELEKLFKSYGVDMELAR